MRTILRPVLMSLLAVSLVACAARGRDGATRWSDRAGAPESRRFRFTYEVTIPARNAGVDHLDVWVPLPHEDPGVQAVDDLEVTASARFRITTDPDYGNRMVHVRVSSPVSPTRVTWSATVTRYVDSGQGSLPADARFLAPNARIPLAGKASEMAASLGADDGALPIKDRAKLIYDDVLNGMEYDRSGAGWGRGDFGHAVGVCKGNCTDFHARFIGVGRAAGIPVRFTMGVPLKAGRHSCASYHCWAHWFDGERWRPVDISEADKVFAADPDRAGWYFGHLGTDRIGLTVGRDITLEPPQRGAKLNYFVFPYAEADGRAVKLRKPDWRFTWQDL